MVGTLLRLQHKVRWRSTCISVLIPEQRSSCASSRCLLLHLPGALHRTAVACTRAADRQALFQGSGKGLGKSCRCCHCPGATPVSFLTMEQGKPSITVHAILQAQMRSVGLDYFFPKLEWMKGIVCSDLRTNSSLETTEPIQDKPQQFLSVVCFVHHGDMFVQSHSVQGLGKQAVAMLPRRLQGQSEDVFPTEQKFFCL